MKDDDLDVAFDAWTSGDAVALSAMGVTSARDLIAVAERIHRRGDPAAARRVFKAARKRDPRVPLLGNERVLASRRYGTVKREIADLLDWNPQFLRVSIYTPRSVTSSAMRIIRCNVAPTTAWFGWWTEEDMVTAARRFAWHNIMGDAVADSWETNERIDRRGITAAAVEYVDRMLADKGIGELFGTPGHHRVTASGFAIVEGEWVW